jgi:thiol-disulfide isomerase/thioredoxin
MRSTRARTRPFALALGVALLLAACGSSDDGGDAAPSASGSGGSATSPAASEGGDAPAASGVAFEAATLDGGTLSSEDLAGKDAVLWFWAPWCTTCRGEAPNVTAAAAAFEGEVEVIGVAGRGEVPEMEGFVSDTDTGALTHLIDEDGAIWSDYGVVAQPAFAFIDDDGTVDVVVGALGEDALTERLSALAAA